MIKQGQDKKYKLSIKKWVKLTRVRDHLFMPDIIFVYQIQALRDIPRHGVKTGDKGGYVTNDNILSHEGDAWIGKNAVVKGHRSGESHISGNALVQGNYFLKNSYVSGNAIISGEGGVIEDSKISENAKISGVIVSVNSNISASSRITYIPKIEFGNSNELYSSPIDALFFVDCNLSNAMITGNGLLQNIFNKHDFIVDGMFRLKFRLYDRNIPLTQPFKATGRIDADYISIKATPVNISGSSTLTSVTIDGQSFNMSGGKILGTVCHGIVNISGKVDIAGAKFEGDNTIRDNASIEGQSHFRGRNIISGNALISKGSKVYNQDLKNDFSSVKSMPTIDGKPLEMSDEVILEAVLKRINSMPSKVKIAKDPNDINIAYYTDVIKSIENDYNVYTTDIVKLIQYPAMVDASVPETRKFLVSLRNAQRVLKHDNFELLEKVSTELDHAFVEAENNAFVLAATFLNESKKTSLKRAGGALAIALDEKANEHERRAGYKSVLKSLEGVLPVSEKAVTVLKERIGLKEIEA